MTRQKAGEQDLQLQGQRVTAEGVRAHHSYEDFNAYDINLYSEDSDCSSSGFLQPVPSLPGLAEPPLQGGAAVLTQAAGSSGIKLKKQDAGASSSSSSSALSPTKHQAWRQGHMQRVPGAAAGHLLQSLPAAGSLTAQHQSSNRTGAGKAAQAALPELKLPAVASKALPVPPLSSPQSNRLQHAAGRGRHQGGGLTCAQAAYDRTGSMTMIQVPEGVTTGQDAVCFFCSGAGKTGDLIYCNLAQSLPSTSSCNSTGVGQTAASPAPALGQQHSFTSGMHTTGAAAAAAAAGGDAGFYGDEYNPYELRAVPQQLANKQQHWVISYHGVTQMRLGEPPELTPHPEWLRQSELFAVLKGLSFFKQWRMRTAFKLWRSVTIRLRFLARAEAVENALLSKHPAVQTTLQEAHWLCLHLSAAAAPHKMPLMQPSKPPPAAAAEHPASAAGTTNQQQQGAQVPVGGAEALVQGQTAPPLAVPVPGAAVAVPNATSASNADHSGSASGQQMPATVLSSSREPVWQKCAGQGRWRLVQQHSSGRLQAAVLAAEASNASGEDDEAMTSSTHGITSAAANAALVDELASAAKGLLPQLQSRGDGFGAVAANAQAGARGEAAVLGLEEQMQAVTAHSARLLKVLCSVLQPEAAVTLADLEAWRASAQAVVAKTMSSVQARILGCMGRLQQQLATELAARQAAAAAEKQAANQAGKKPLPWNIPAAFNLSLEKHAVQVLLDRVAHVINVLVTSHTAQLAGAATAYLLSYLVAAVDADAALRLCPQLQLVRLRCFSTRPGVKLRLHATLEDEQPAQQDHAGTISARCAGSSHVLRLTPAFEDVLQLCGSLPCVVAAAAASLELLPVTAPKACGSYITGRASEGGGRPYCGADRLGQSSSRTRLPSGRARNVRLETVMNACRSVEVQGMVYDVLEEQYQHTLCSSHMHPYVHAPELLQFCSTLDAQAYAASQPTARQLASEFETLGAWLAQLSASSHHISILHSRVATGDYGMEQQHAAGLRAAPSISGSCGMVGSSSNGSWDGSAGAGARRQGHGLLELDVSTVRPVLIKAGRAALGSLLTILPQAFMQCSGSLRTQLEDATATASQRPDSLEGFILWQAAMQSPASASGGQRASCMHGPVLAGSTGRGSFCGGDAVRVGLLAEVEALRTLLDVLRPSSAASGSCPDWLSASQVGYSSSGSRMQARAGHINEAREAVLQAARQHGPAAVKSAASTLSSLQALVMTYKDAVRAASAHSALMAKKLGPLMAQLLEEDHNQLEQLERQLSGQLAKQSGDAADALAMIQTIQQQQLELKIMHEDHLHTAAGFPTKQVAQALAAYQATSDALHKRLRALSDLRIAQQAWDHQLEALHATPADSTECRQRLAKLEAAGQALTLSAKALQELHTTKPMPHRNSGTEQSSQSSDAVTATPQPAPSAAAVADAAAVSLLCQEVLLEVTAWQQRMPAAALLLRPAMLRRHVLMLLALKAMADGGSIHALQRVCAGVVGGVQSNGMTGSDARTYAVQVHQALLHYDLMRRDYYEAVFLTNSATIAGADSSATEEDCQATQGGRKAPGAAAAVGREPAGVHNSLAALLVWVSRNCSTRFLLEQVVEIAERERQLSEQVSAVAAQLEGLHVTVGAVRVAGVFMGGFADVRQQLQATRQQLASVWQDPCHVGVLERLTAVQDLQDEMPSAAQACKECQELLLRLHNLCSHPALSTCLSDGHHAAVVAAIKPWASALLKLRCSPTAAAARSSAGGACAARQASTGAACGRDCSDVGCPSEPGGGFEPGAAAVQEHRWGGCRQHLAAAAAQSLGLMQKALDSVSATVLPVLHQRWPRLGLVRDDTLLQLLTELPAVFRAAWTVQQQMQHLHTAREVLQMQHRPQQQQEAEQLQGEKHSGPQAFLRLPQPLLDTLFRGVNAMEVVAPAAAQGQQLGGNQSQVDSDSSSDTGKPSITGSAAQTASAAAGAPAQSLSGCAWEPLSAAELASGVGQVHIAALISAGNCAGSSASGCSSSTASLSTPVVGEVLQRLSLQDAAGCSASSGVLSQGPAVPSHGQDGAADGSSSGILWDIDSCPAVVLEAIHAGASQALKRELATALTTAGGMPVEDWAAAPSQVLALADAVMWTKAAAGALQQFAAGNSRALRSLCDAATLRLETVSAALRSQRHAGNSSAGAPAPAAGRRIQQEGGAAPARAATGALGQTAAAGRPATPDTCDEVPHISPRRKPPAPIGGRMNSSSQPPMGHLAPAGGNSSTKAAHSSFEPRQLSQQQVLGLQTLASAATSHRDVAAALVAAAAEGDMSCVWQQQLRHYWDPETQELQVCWGPCQVPYGWQYSPAASGCPSQPLTSALTSGPSLLAAAAALEVSAVLGLDITSWCDSSSVYGRSPSSTMLSNADGGSTSCSGSRGDASAPRVLPSCADVTDVLAGLLGVQAFHLTCNSSTTSQQIHTWLQPLQTAAGAAMMAPHAASPRSSRSKAAAPVDSSALDGMPGSTCTILCSISGMQHLPATVLSAVTQALMLLRKTISQKASSEGCCCGDGSTGSNGSSSSGCCECVGCSRGSSIPWPLCVLCEVPPQADGIAAATSDAGVGCAAAVTATMAAGAAGQGNVKAAQRRAVLGALQLAGRCVVVQPAKVSTLVELGLRHLGLTDVKPCAAVLADLLQLAANMAAAAASTAVAAGGGVASAAGQTSMLHGSGLQQRLGVVHASSVRCILRHLSGLLFQQQSSSGSGSSGSSSSTSMQPGCSSWVCLQPVVQDLLLPWVQSHGGHGGQVTEALQRALQAAQGAGSISSTFVTQSVPGGSGVGTISTHTTQQQQGGLGQHSSTQAGRQRGDVAAGAGAHVLKRLGAEQQQLQGVGVLSAAPERVAAVARALCEEWHQHAQQPQQQQQKGLARGGCSAGSYSTRGTSKLPHGPATAAAVDAVAAGPQAHSGSVSGASSSFMLRQPVCLKPEAAAEAAAAVHRALQLHGTCLLLGPSGVGKSLVWKLLAAVYQHLQQQQGGHESRPQHSSLSSKEPSRQQQQQQEEGLNCGQPGGVSWVHCFPHVLLEAVQAADAGAGQGAPVESLLQLLRSYYHTVQQTNLQQGWSDIAPRSSEAPSPPAGSSAAAQTRLGPGLQQSGTAPGTVLVLDTGMIGKPGELQQLLMHLLQQQAGRAVSHSPGQHPGGWGGLASCMGCIIEADCVAGVDPALLQQLPAVVLAAPGVLDHKQQLQGDVRGAFRSLSVAVGACGDPNPDPGLYAGVVLPAPTELAAETGGGGAAGAAAEPGAVAAAGAVRAAAVPADVGSFVRGSTTQLSLSPDSSNSLSSLLEELVAAGLAVINQHTSTPPSRQTAVRQALEASAAATSRASVAAAATAGCHAAAPATPAASGDLGCLEAGRQQLQTYQLASCAIALAGAMWSRATLGSSQLLNAGLVTPKPDSLHPIAAGVGGGSTPSGLPCPPTAAEQLAARLLLFAVSWVLSGSCSEPERQLGPLHSTLLAVLSGAGYAWAVPPGGLGLLGARVSLSSGLWVPWEEDVKALRGCGRSLWDPCDRVGAGSAQQHGSCGSSGEAGGGGNGGGVSSGCSGAEGQLQQYHVCSAEGVDAESEVWDLSPAAGAAAMHAAYSSGSLRGARTPGGVFLHSERTCALQCILYWMLQASLSPVLQTHSGSGVATAVQHLLSHTWGIAGAPGAQLLSGSCCSLGVVASSGSAVDSGASSGGTVVLQMPAGMQASQAAVLLQANQLNQKLQTARVAAAEGRTNSSSSSSSGIKPLLLMMHTSGGWGGGSCTPEWLRQLLESSTAAAVGAVLLPGALREAGAAVGLSGRGNRAWVRVPPAQLLSIVAAEPRTPAAAASPRWKSNPGTASRHLLHFNCDCFAAISDSGVTAAGSVGTCISRSVGHTPHMSMVSKQPLVQPNEVVGVLIDHWGHLLPGVPHVPRHLQLSALQEIWCELCEVAHGLQQQQLLPGVSSICCYFGLPQLQSSLLQLAVLCEQAAEQCSLAGSSARQQQQQNAFSMVPQTPCTPAAGLLDPVTPGSCMTLHRLWGRRLPLKTLCLMVVEALSRTVADGAPTAEQQHALHRLVVLLVVQHLVALDSTSNTRAAAAAPAASAAAQSHTQQPAATASSNHAAAPAAQHNHAQPPATAGASSSTTSSSSSSTSISTNPAATAHSCVQQPAVGASSSSSSSSTSSSTPRGPYLLKTLAAAVAEQQAASEAPHRISHSHHTPAAILQQQQQGHRTALRLQQQQQSGHLSALWQLLQQLTEAEFAEALREELSPAPQALLSGRYISQLMAMAALGQDPVQLGQPLHLDAARAELTQLAVHTHIQAQQQQQQQPQRRGQEQQQLQQVWTPRRTAMSVAFHPTSSRRSSTSTITQGAVPAAAAAAGTSRRTSTPTSSSSSSSSNSSRPCADSAALSAVSGAGRLLHSSMWIAAAHKLMWHLELANARGLWGCFGGTEGYGSTTDAASAWTDYPATAGGGSTGNRAAAGAAAGAAASGGASAAAGAGEASRAAVMPVSAAVQSVVLLSGPSVPCLQAAAAVAAAAVSCRVDTRSLAELSTAREGGMVQLLLTGSGDTAAEAGAGSRVGEGGPRGVQQRSDQQHQKKYASNQIQQQQQYTEGQEEEGADLAHVVLLVDLTAAGNPLDSEAAAALQRWCCPAPWVTTGAAATTPAAAGAAGVAAPWRPVHLVLMCAPSQRGQLDAILGPQCYRLALPALLRPCGVDTPTSVELSSAAAAAAAAAGPASREQLEGDCKAQLMQQCSSDLLDHLQDAARCIQQHGEARMVGQHAQQHPQQQQEGEGVAVQQQQQGPGVTAGAMPAAARRLAERLAGVLAEAHFTAIDAHTQQLSTHSGAGARLSTRNTPCSGSIKDGYASHVGALQALPQPKFAGAATCSSSSSSSSTESRTCASSLWSAQDLACQAVPLWKPADAICGMQQLLRALRQPLLAKRSALAAGIAGARRYMTLLRQTSAAATAGAAAAMDANATTGGVAAAAAALVNVAERTLSESTAGAPAAAAASGAAGKLLADLGVLEAKWAGEFDKVNQALVQLLPDSMLAVLQLTYLGALPDATQQQLSATWADLLARAAAPESKQGTVPAAAVATTAGMQQPHAAFTVGSSHQGSGPGGVCSTTDSIAASWDSLLRLGGGQYPIPGSVLMREAALLLQRGMLAQQLQLAVAAIDLAGRPVLVVDSLGLLLRVLQLPTELGGASGAVVSSGGANDKVADSSSSGGSGGSQQWVVVRYEHGADAGAAAAAASVAFAGCRDVCLRLHNITTQQEEELVHRVVAAWHGAQLLQQEYPSLGSMCSPNVLTSSSSRKGLGSSRSKAAAWLSTRLAPRLLVHLESPCAVLPVGVAGLLGVVGVGAECNLQPAADSLGPQLPAAVGVAAAMSAGPGGNHHQVPGVGESVQRLQEERDEGAPARSLMGWPAAAAPQQPDRQDGAGLSDVGCTLQPDGGVREAGVQLERQQELGQHGWVYEAVQRVVLLLVEQQGCRAALAAQLAAEDILEEAERTEAMLLKHAAQEPSSHATQSALLQSLTREAQQLLQQTSTTGPATDSTQGALTKWQPLVAALSNILEAAASYGSYRRQHEGSVSHMSAPGGASSQRLQRLLVQLPWVLLEVLLLRAITAGLEAASQAAGADADVAATTAGGMLAGGAAVRSSASGHHHAVGDNLSAPAAAAATAAVPGGVLAGATGTPAPMSASTPYQMSKCVRAASMQLLQDLALLLPHHSSTSRTSTQSCNSSSGTVDTAVPAAPQADGLLLQQVLAVVPAAVPIAVCGTTSAAAVAAVVEAAAAAGLQSSCILIEHCGVQGQQGLSAAATAAAEPSLPKGLQQPHKRGAKLVPQGSSSSEATGCWRVLLVDSSAAVPAALAAVQQLRHQQNKVRCRHSGGGCDLGGVRIWLALSSVVLLCSWRLLEGVCLLHQPQLLLLRQQQQQDGEHTMQEDQEQLGVSSPAAGAVSVLLQAQGLSELLQQQYQGLATAAAVAEGGGVSKLWLPTSWRPSSPCSSSSANAARGHVSWRAGYSSSSGGSSSSSSNDSSLQLCILQPLMVAAAAAAAGCLDAGECMSTSGPVCSEASASQHMDAAYQAGCLTARAETPGSAHPSDLRGMYDWVHTKLLLQRVAACATQQHLRLHSGVAAAAAASTAGAPAAAASERAGAHARGARGASGAVLRGCEGSGGGSALVVAESGVQHRKLPHQSFLQLDLQQVQQLLLWAVLGPGCASQQQLAAAVAALSEAFSAEALGVRDRQELHAGVQVDGGCIADAIECISGSRMRRKQEGGGGRWSEDSAGEGQSEVVLPLGMCLGLEDLCALLDRRLG